MYQCVPQVINEYFVIQRQ